MRLKYRILYVNEDGTAVLVDNNLRAHVRVIYRRFIMRTFNTRTDAAAWNYLHRQCSEVGDAVRTDFNEYNGEIYMEFRHVYFVACLIRQGIEAEVPQPPQYLRAWAAFDKMHVEEKDGRHFLRFNHLKTGDIEVLDYTPRDDGEDEFLVVVHPVENRQWQVVFFERGEYRHKNMVRDLT